MTPPLRLPVSRFRLALVGLGSRVKVLEVVSNESSVAGWSVLMGILDATFVATVLLGLL